MCCPFYLYEVTIFVYFCLFSKVISFVNLLPAFHTKPAFISVNKVGLFKEQTVRPSFLIQFDKWCLLMGEFSPLTFIVNTDRYVVMPDI
jgi:hypothetical protein